MPTRRVIRVLRKNNEYKVIIDSAGYSLTLNVTPQVTEINGQTILVGKNAEAFYWAIAMRQKEILREMIPTIEYIFNLLTT